MLIILLFSNFSVNSLFMLLKTNPLTLSVYNIHKLHTFFIRIFAEPQIFLIFWKFEPWSILRLFCKFIVIFSVVAIGYFHATGEK